MLCALLGQQQQMHHEWDSDGLHHECDEILAEILIYIHTRWLCG